MKGSGEIKIITSAWAASQGKTEYNVLAFQMFPIFWNKEVKILRYLSIALSELPET
jgi:hypothetical protein